MLISSSQHSSCSASLRQLRLQLTSCKDIMFHVKTNKTRADPAHTSKRQSSTEEHLHANKQTLFCTGPAGLRNAVDQRGSSRLAAGRLHRHPVLLSRRAPTVRLTFMRGRGLKVADLASASRLDSRLHHEHHSDGARAPPLPPPPPRAGGTQLNSPSPSPSPSRCLPPVLSPPARVVSVAGYLARSPLGAHRWLFSGLSGAHCHSISTTRMPLIGQAETLALSQSGVPIHRRQPITAAL